MNKFLLPSALTILFSLLVLTAFLTWIIPSGKYDTLAFNKPSNEFIVTKTNSKTIIPATQASLDSLNIKLPIQSFIKGDINKPINIPNTFKFLSGNKQGFADMAMAPVKGVVEAADIIFFVLILGGMIGVVNSSGAFNAGIFHLSKILKGQEYWLIIITMTLSAVGGTMFGLAEETIAFYPLLIPVFLVARYDVIIVLSSLFLGSTLGTMCSTVNPFSAIIASNVAGVNWTTGIESRFISLFVGLIICLVFTLRYAARVKKNPLSSIVYDQRGDFNLPLNTNNQLQFTNQKRLILLVFLLCFVVMIFGVAKLQWWFAEMSAVFLVGAIIIGFINQTNEKQFWQIYIKGAEELLSVAIIIGVARGISILMADGMIGDTMLYYASSIAEGTPKWLFINIMMFIYAVLSFFIPSSSGMAVLTMPIFAPLADSIGVGRDAVVTAYQFGMGLFSFINPTSLILASLAIVNVSFNKWLRFVLPLVLILTLASVIILTIIVI